MNSLPNSAASNRSPVKEGDILADKYRVDGVLGIGGMGVVVSATHVHLGQRVAVKFLLPEAMVHPQALERFGREARAAVRLKSDHAARVLDVGSLADGAPYMVMEYLDGCDLGTLAQDKGALAVSDAVEYVMQACDAIAEAHSLGIVHRDLKPRNLFLTRKLSGAPCIKVLDFGISKVTTIGGDHSLTKTSDVMGSPNYMAPEQIRSSRDVDERTDIWALGVILYELISGRVPFLADTVPALCAMVLEKAPTPLEELRPDCPPELRHVIARCLMKDPTMRFQSVAELANVLAQFVTGPSVASTVRWSSDMPPGPPMVSPRARTGSSARVMVSGGTSVTWGETQLGRKPGVSRAFVGVIAFVAAALAIFGTVAFLRLRAPATAASTTVTNSAAAQPSASASSIVEPIAATPIVDAGARDAQPHVAQHPMPLPTSKATATTTATTTATATATVAPPATTSGGGDLPRERK